MSENLLEQWRVLPGNLANHLMITVIPLVIGAAVSLPLAVLVVKHPRLRYPTLTVVSIIQTIPSLALLALMYPLLLGVSALLMMLMGVEISALGFPPTVVALTLYSMLPMVRNTVTGITGVEPAVVEAARGVGMTPRQVLWKVELPLAAPVIIAGVRTATVWVVGIATLATPVGQRCLGNYIFRGLQTQNWTAVTFGCIAAALLAILLDLLIGGVECGVRERKRSLGLASGIALIVIFAVGMIAPSAVRWVKRSSGAASGETVIVGAKTFTEQYILAELIADLLEDAGMQARAKESLGSAIIFNALTAGEIDCYVDYSGTIWANYMNRKGAPEPQKLMSEMTKWLRREHGVTCLGSLGFENKYGLAMRRDEAEKRAIRTIGDLTQYAPEMSIGGDYEFFGRPEWRAIRDEYELSFANQISYDSTFMYKAVHQRKVDVISAFTSDGRIAAFDLVLLEDKRGAIPPYHGVLLLAPGVSDNEQVKSALRPLIGAIDIETMRKVNYSVDRNKNKRTVEEAARWLRKQSIPPAAETQPTTAPATAPAR